MRASQVFSKEGSTSMHEQDRNIASDGTMERDSKSPCVAIVILNWNDAVETLGCLRSVSEITYPNFFTLVVDNASSDDSMTIIRSEFPELPVVLNSENLGYAGGNNAGIRAALARGAEYCLLLNNDVRVDPAVLTELVSATIQDETIGIAGPKVYHREDPSCLQSVGGRLDRRFQGTLIGAGQVDNGQFDQRAEVDYVSGCAFFVRRSVIEKIGFLDERFFIYWEEVDWCHRTRQAGFRIIYVPGANVWHRRHEASERNLPFMTYYMNRSALLFYTKRRAWWCLLRYGLIQQGIWLLNWTINPKWRHRCRERDALARALLDFGRRRFGRADMVF